MTTNNIKPSLPINQIVKEINWPLLASIAVHGIFFTTVFPRWYSQGNSINPNGLANTPVIELNSLEQTRLPNLNPSNSFNWDSLNPLPEVNNFDGLTIPLPPLDNTGFDLPEIDNSGIYNDFAALPPPPAGMTDFSALPMPQTSFDLNPSNPSPINLPPPPPINKNSLANLPPIPQEKIDEIKARNNTNSSPFNPDMPVNQILDEERQAEIRRQLFANSPIEVTVNPRDIINNRDNKVDLKNNSVDVVAGGNPLNSDLVEKLAKNPENTSDEEARKNYVAWAQKVENVTPKEITLAGVYPKDACVKKLEGTTTYGITVNAMGNVVDSQLIKSSGYSLFNEQALKQISARQFENTGNANTPYHVYVNFKYDTKVCPSVSLTNLGDTPATPPKNSAPPTPVTPKPNSATTNPPQSPPANSSTKKDTENKPNTPVISQPTRVNNLPNPNNSADALKIPSQSEKNPVKPPKLPPIIQSVPKKDGEQTTPSVREMINSPSETKSENQKSSENEANTNIQKQDSSSIINDGN